MSPHHRRIVFATIVAALVSSFSPRSADAQCGQDGSRACCFCERGINACDPGTLPAESCVDAVANDDDCNCAGPTCLGARSLNICRAPACGGDGQRGCCIGAERSARGLSGPCAQGYTEVGGCEGAACACLVPAGSRSTGVCRPFLPCGGDGQRACCAITSEVVAGHNCGPGLVEIPGCTGGNCLCGGTNPFGINSSGICIRPTPCGGEGQRACCFGLNEGDTCGAGMREVPGCSGDCWCGGSASSGQRSSGTCARASGPVVDTTISEPATGFTPSGVTAACPTRGYADMHLHLFAETAHGGGVLAGKAWDPAGIGAALQQDYGTNLDLVTKSGGSVPSPSCPDYAPGCGSKLFHGDHTPLDDTVGFGSADGTNGNFGAPIFNAWPRWSNVTHQQAYWKWLERAYQGGLRMVSMLAVSNEALCKSNKHLRTATCDNSMTAIDQQLDAAWAFPTWLDGQSGGPGSGWFRIVTTPAQARAAIASGKMAVILGIEVDNLFNCFAPTASGRTPCTPAFVQSELDRYQAKGVVHIFPIHNFDNGYGATATWLDPVNVGNRVSEGAYYTTENCAPEGYGFRLDNAYSLIIGTLGFGHLGLEPPTFPYFLQTATCNSKTLSGLGGYLVREMMERRMMIDIDHMGRRSFNATLDLADAYRYNPPQTGVCTDSGVCGGGAYCCGPTSRWPGACVPHVGLCEDTYEGYPVVASHTLMFDLYQPSARTERMRTRAQLERIRLLGGMISPITEMRDADDANQVRRSVRYGAVANDCMRSSKTMAQVVQYGIDAMGASVGLGTDFNGIAFHLSPRFGNEGCAGNAPDRELQYRANDRLQYPFTADVFGTFAKQVTGKKVYDYNVDGLAHVGLLPDMVADMARVGLPPAYQDSFFRSAEEMIQTWERMRRERPKVRPKVDAAACSGTTEVRVGDQCLATSDEFARAISGDPAFTAVLNPPGPYAPGAYTVAMAVNDPCGSGGAVSCQKTFNVVDKTPPRISCPPDVTVQAAEGENFVVVDLEPFGVTDNCGADQVFVSCTGSDGHGGSSYPVGARINRCTARDRYQNAAACSTRVTVLPWDFSPPTVTGTLIPAFPGALQVDGWYGTQIAFVSLRASDNDAVRNTWYSLSGATIQGPTRVGGPFADFGITAEGVTTVTFWAEDMTGQVSGTQTLEVKLDRSPPTLTFLPQIPAANGFGWNNTPVALPFLADDAGVGVGTVLPQDFEIYLVEEGRDRRTVITATDRLGNTASLETPLGIHIDLTPPEVQWGPALDPPSAAGWYRTDAYFGYIVTDALSGWDFPPNDNGLVAVTAEGDPAQVAFRPRDRAGNAANVLTPPVRIDRTPPFAVFGTPSPAANAAGWHRTDVALPFTAGDALSGVAASSLASPLVVVGEGAGLTREVTIVDVAGNTAVVTSPAVRIDRTPPALSFGPAFPAPNAFGWNDSPVVFPLVPSDALSGVAGTSPAGTLELSDEGAAVTGAVTVTDVAGNAASFTSPAVKIDRTPPAASCARTSAAPNANGWHRDSVDFSCTFTDALSGAFPASREVTVAGEGVGLTASIGAEDEAGNAAFATTPPANIDRTPPSVVLGAQSPPANLAGWNNTDVLFPFDAADALSGVDTTLTSASPLVISGEGTALSGTVVVVDRAGNSAGLTSPAVKIDRTPPTATFGPPFTSPNASGWYRAQVTFPCTFADALSGVAGALTRNVAVTAEGLGVTGSVSKTDLAGNSAVFETPRVNVDRTPPLVTLAAQTPAANANGWNNTDVSFAWSATDAHSGLDPATVPANPFVITGEGNPLSTFIGVQDIAGNFGGVETPPVRIDRTPPNILWFRAVPAPNAAGWNNGPVDWEYFTNDLHSGVAISSPASPLTFTSEGAGQTRVVTATDLAGNTASSSSPPVSIDTTPPAIAFGPQSPAPNAAGWNNADVSVPYTASDALSGLAASAPASPVALTAEGSAVTAQVTATDVAGNVATAVTPAARIDRTPPSISFGAPSPAANAAGWNSGDVAIPFSASDSGSGVASTDPVASPLAIGGEGAGLTRTVGATDSAGNSASATSPAVSIDRTAPVTTLTLADGDGDGVPSSFTLAATDAGSGVASTEYALNGGALVAYPAAGVTIPPGTTSIAFRSTDGAGNAEATHTVDARPDRCPDVRGLNAPREYVLEVLGFETTTSPASGVARTARVFAGNTEVLPGADGKYRVPLFREDGSAIVDSTNYEALPKGVWIVDRKAPRATGARGEGALRAGLWGRFSAAGYTWMRTRARLEGAVNVVPDRGDHFERYKDGIALQGRVDQDELTITAENDGTTILAETSVRQGADIYLVESADLEGCPFGDRTFVYLHDVDRGTVQPVAGVGVKIFDRDQPSFVSTFGRRPSRHLFDDIYESGIGLVGQCTTDASGQCLAPEDHPGRFLVVAKLVDAAAGVSVYQGRQKNFHGRVLNDHEEDESDDEDDDVVRISDRVKHKALRFMKQTKRSGRVDYSSSGRSIVIGSQIAIDTPDYVLWTEREALYPLVFSSEEEWTVDVCLNVVDGYQVAGVLDASGEIVDSSACVHTGVAGEQKVFLFRVLDLQSPEPDFTLAMNVQRVGGKLTRVEKRVEGMRAWTEAEVEREVRAKLGEVTGSTEVLLPRAPAVALTAGAGGVGARAGAGSLASHAVPVAAASAAPAPPRALVSWPLRGGMAGLAFASLLVAGVAFRAKRRRGPAGSGA